MYEECLEIMKVLASKIEGFCTGGIGEREVE